VTQPQARIAPTKCEGCGMTITPADATHCETCAAEEIAEAALIAGVQKALTPYVVSGQLRPRI
jgi:uncharacterized OB-fold protein